MDALPREVGYFHFLDLDSSEFGSKVTETFFNNYPELKKSKPPITFERVQIDTVRDLEYLDFALSNSDPQLFKDYLDWATRVRISRGAKKEILAQRYQVFLEAIKESSSLKDHPETIQSLEQIFLEIYKSKSITPETPFLEENIKTIGSIFLSSILKGNRHGALKIVQEAFKQGASLKDFYLKIVQPAMYEVGRLWEINKITVSQEHLATAITQYVMVHTYYQFVPENNGKAKGKICLSGVGGELHEIGLQIVGGLLELDGWEVLYLGTNSPDESIIETIKSEDIDVLGISVTMFFNLHIAERLIKKIRAEKSLEHCKVIVGGRSFCIEKLKDEYWKSIGADGFGYDGEDAVRVIESLI